MTDEDCKRVYSIDIGIDVHIWRGHLYYASGPDREHRIKGEFGKYIDGGFTWISKGFSPGEWTIEELTINAFKHKYFKCLMDKRLQPCRPPRTYGNIIANSAG